VSAGSLFTCVIASDNKAYCWGSNTNGRLGNSSTTQSNVPVAVTTSGVLSGKTILQISSGLNSVCVIASDYKVYCWGDNSQLQLGANTTASGSTSPVAVQMTGTALALKNPIRTISGHISQFFCVIGNDNNPYCWGHGGDGNLGNNTWVDSKVPVAVNLTGVLSGQTIKRLHSGQSHSCSITNSNSIACWGKGNSGQLGDGLTTTSAIPLNTTMSGVLAGKMALEITTGDKNSCVYTTEKRFYCWGSNNSSQFDTSGANFTVPMDTSTGTLSGFAF
jgi:alpha-tubulin suppressor-like RCC1 family protein